MPHSLYIMLIVLDVISQLLYVYFYKNFANFSQRVNDSRTLSIKKEATVSNSQPQVHSADMYRNLIIILIYI